MSGEQRGGGSEYLWWSRCSLSRKSPNLRLVGSCPLSVPSPWSYLFLEEGPREFCAAFEYVRLSSADAILPPVPFLGLSEATTRQSLHGEKERKPAKGNTQDGSGDDDFLLPLFLPKKSIEGGKEGLKTIRGKGLPPPHPFAVDRHGRAERTLPPKRPPQDLLPPMGQPISASLPSPPSGLSHTANYFQENTFVHETSIQ